MSDTVATAPPRERAMQEQRIAKNFAAFEHYLARAQGYLAQGELDAAAVHCAVASHIPVQNHAGIFWSPRAEKVLAEIGARLPRASAPAPRVKEHRRILQVGTQMAAVGGLTKMLGQWVAADSAREHSLVLTQQRGPVPTFVDECFGGRITRLNTRPGGFAAWAMHLRELACGYDLVVLHTYCEDVIPLLAFAEPGRHPPVLVLNHADHLFWYGPSVCHLSINLRDAAQDLAIARRGIAPERNILMPTVAEASVRTRTREDAKRALGIDPGVTLMVSVARKLKYKTVHGMTFADIHAPVLERYPDAMLLIVGADEPEDWAPVRTRFGDRIRSTPELPNPKIYFEAADIYVDSYPFVSSTSLMEAAGYGAPSVTIFTYPQETRIFGINHVALVGNTLQATSFEQYREMLGELIADPGMRERLGEKARAAVAKEHNMPGWLRWLEAVYARAAELAPLDNRAMLDAVETPHFGEPDWRHEDIFGGNWPIAQFLKSYIGVLPLHQRIAHWRELRAAGAFDGAASEISHTLLPEWLKRSVKG
ncbi:MAG: glycosyltransferase family 4 protein [Phycisphaerales bacterium]|nr:glycosyltransferase family 4 protein [Hyphomonadaceae bacterium]